VASVVLWCVKWEKGLSSAVLRSEEDVLVDKIFRNAYGADYTWDGENQRLAKRKGVGTIEDGPTIPKVTIPTGKVGNKTHKKAKSPTAVIASSVEPADLGFEMALTGTKGDVDAQSRARAKAKAYISSKS
tara:strand:+ start:406 stop:795 length:390 start_codon:yes stop_codon:yes gene_type:complete